MPKSATNGKTKQMVTRVPIQAAQQIEMLARQNSVTTTAVVNKLIAIGLGRLPPEIVKRMVEEIAIQEMQKRESNGTEAELALLRWSHQMPS